MVVRGDCRGEMVRRGWMLNLDGLVLFRHGVQVFLTLFSIESCSRNGISLVVTDCMGMGRAMLPCGAEGEGRGNALSGRVLVCLRSSTCESTSRNVASSELKRDEGSKKTT